MRKLAEQYPICPKCKCISGDDWSQCGGKCPLRMSPHFDQPTFNQHGGLRPATPEEMYGSADDGHDYFARSSNTEEIPY